jgi:hypothetical protein
MNTPLPSDNGARTGKARIAARPPRVECAAARAAGVAAASWWTDQRRHDRSLAADVDGKIAAVGPRRVFTLVFWVLFWVINGSIVLGLIWGTVDLLSDGEYLRAVRLWATIVACCLLGWFMTPLWQFFTRGLARIRAVFRARC